MAERRVLVVQLVNGHALNALEPLSVLGPKIEASRQAAARHELEPMIDCTYLLRTSEGLTSTEPGAFGGELVVQYYSTTVDTDG